MKKSEKLKHLAEIQAQQDIANFQGDLTRARSVTVGTAFGGTTEVSMRGSNGTTLWSIMQPVEVIELIHQLAANVGCHIALKPREDFSSWRGWKVSEEERLHLNGHPPFSDDISQFNQLGISGVPEKEFDPVSNLAAGGGAGGGTSYRKQQVAESMEKEQDHVMATQKTVDK
jgi:hypothetical protein